MEILENPIADREQVTCPICGRELFATTLPDGKTRFHGCGRNCAPNYWVPEDSILFGLQGGPMFVYRKKWNPYEPTSLMPRYTSGAW